MKSYFELALAKKIPWSRTNSKNTNGEWGNVHLPPFPSNEAVRPQGQILHSECHLLACDITSPNVRVWDPGCHAWWAFHRAATEAGRLLWPRSQGLHRTFWPWNQHNAHGHHQITDIQPMRSRLWRVRIRFQRNMHAYMERGLERSQLWCFHVSIQGA